MIKFFSDVSGLRQILQEEWVICRIFHKITGGTDHKKTPMFYPHNPMCSSQNPNSLFPYLDFKTLDNPILHSLHNHQPCNNLHYQEPDVNLFPLPPLPPSPFQSDINPNEEIALAPATPPNWLETFLQSPFIYHDSSFVGPNFTGAAQSVDILEVVKSI